MGRHWLVGAGVVVALLVAALLVVAPPATGPPDAVPARLPAGSLVSVPTVLEDGSSYTLRYVVDPRTTVGIASDPDGSRFAVVVVDGDRIRFRVRSVPTPDGPFFDAFVFYEGSIYWTETTTRADGTDATALWSVAVSTTDVGQPRVVVPDMGNVALSSSAYDIIIADDLITWTVIAGAGQGGTLVRSVPVAEGRAPVSERAWPGTWRQIGRPWLASTGPGPTVLLNQDSGEQVTVPGSEDARTECSPHHCRVTVTSGADAVRLELMAPDGTGRTRIAGPGTTFATVDPLAFGRYELLSQPTGSRPDQERRLLLYDTRSATTVAVETGPPALVQVRDGWAWWLAGDFATPVWHALDLRLLEAT